MEKKEYRAIDIPSLIRFVREKEGMTQKEFAEMFGFKASSPSMWELGKREAPYKILEFVFSRWLQQELDKARKEGYEKAIKDMMLFSFGWEYDLKTQQYLGKIPFSEEAVNLCTEKGTAERLSILSAKRKELSKLKDNRVYGEERI